MTTGLRVWIKKVEVMRMGKMGIGMGTEATRVKSLRMSMAIGLLGTGVDTGYKK